MIYYYDLIRLKHMELAIYECGSENCKPGKSFGPWMRYYYLIHYVHDGKGIFKSNGKVYRIERGQGFVIYPDVVTYYEADMEFPWKYSWVGFCGIKAETYLVQANLSRDNPVFTFTGRDQLSHTLQEMVKVNAAVPGSELRLLSLLYLFLAQLIEEAGKTGCISESLDRGGLYIKKAVEFVGTNYASCISVNDIARFVGLNRSYLCILFKNYLNITPKEFIVNFRVGKACELLSNELLTIADVARMVGYEDQLIFSKIFKKIKGVSPKEFRKNIN